MKKLFSLSLTILCLNGIQAKAQTAFLTMDSVDINNIHSAILVHGDMWNNPQTEDAQCSFPGGSGKNIGFVGALWMGGYDAGSNLHVAAQTYRQDGNDYWPGPLDGSDTLTYATSQNWAKIWKVNASDIAAFQALNAAGTATQSNTAAVIWEWPANGNTYAKGAGGVPLTITTSMAPFVDLNGNGTYEPQLGEYPDIKGDQALWWVFSDNGAAHTETDGKPLGVEVHAMAYAYKRNTSIDNVIYYQYDIVNKSANSYTNFRAGLLADMDLGYYNDDFIGSDSIRGMGIIYNGDVTDMVYGSSLPLAGVILQGGAGLGSIMYYNNDVSNVGNPTTAAQYNNYLRATFRDGTHATDDYTVAGTPTTAHGAGPLTNFVFSGNPEDNTQWSECSSGNMPGDRRFVIASGDASLNTGATEELTFILIATNPGPANACGDGVNFITIDSIADTAISVYDNHGHNLPPPLLSVTNVSAGGSINIYPNPANDKLYIEHSGNDVGEETITLYNMMGQVVSVPVDKNGQKSEADISKLSAGLYNVLYRQGAAQQAVKFIKE